VLATNIVSLMLSGVDISIGSLADLDVYTPFQSISGLAIPIPSLAVAARRSHDIAKSGWWPLLRIAKGVLGAILLVTGAIGLWYMTFVFSGGSNSGNLSLILGLAFAAFFVGLAICAGSIAWMLIWLVKQAQQVRTNTVPTREHGTGRSRPHIWVCNGVARSVMELRDP
jgi:uncharacterized membrane protein YhaH (DUF805 family)